MSSLPAPPSNAARAPWTAPAERASPAGGLIDSLQSAQLARAVDSAANPMLIVDKAARIVWANRAYATLCGIAPKTLIGRTPGSLRPSGATAKFFTRMWASLLEGQTWIGELRETDAAGQAIEMEVVISPLTDAQGRPAMFIMLEHDVTNRNAEYRTLYQAANHDRLTGLANRGLFASLFEHAIDRAHRSSRPLALLYIDLDGFKAVNDTHGHDAGDRVLVEAARLIGESIRRSDIAARVGGDEFCCLLNDLDRHEDAGRVAESIVQALSAPMQLDGITARIGASIGIATFPSHGASIDELRTAADQAMYVAKRSGKNRWCMAGAASA